MSTELLQDILAAFPLPALAIDGGERIIAANDEVVTLLGQSPTGRNYVTMLRQPALLETIGECLRDGAARRAQYLTTEGVNDAVYLTTCRAVPNVGVRNAGVVVVSFEDVTHLEQAGQMRRDFVANVSHELRTPLTAVMGFIETLKGPARNDTEASLRFLDIMQSEAERMNRLVGDLLSLSRVEGEERVRPTEKVSLVGILESVIRSMRPMCEEAGLVVEREFELSDLIIVGDQDQLTQVFTNLIENAIKYGDAGERIRIKLQRLDREPALRGPAARIDVIDYGAGIDPIHLPRLTERFYRADDHRSRAMGGTGLGLAIVKHIINRHRGRLRIDSAPGEGATFSVTLPVTPYIR